MRPGQPDIAGGGWFGGLFNKFKAKGKNEMILPDDKNPAVSCLYDEFFPLRFLMLGIYYTNGQLMQWTQQIPVNLVKSDEETILAMENIAKTCKIM